MTMTLGHRFPPLALLLAGCPAYPVLPDAAESGSSSSSTGDLDPPGGVPTGTDTDDVPGPGTTGEASNGGSTGSVAVCGDGIVDSGEGCDDGAGNGPNAACTSACRPNVCGDGDVYAGVEGCDEGAENVDTGYCRSDCQLGVCGDGFVFAALEECDAAEANGTVYGQCDTNCTINRCGDGELDAGFEECDEGELNGSGQDDEMGLAGCDLDCGFAGRRIFLSSQFFTGDMGTRAGADLACETMAYAAGLRHSERFKALLADAKGAPNDFVQANPQDDRPFILPTGVVLAASYPDLIASGPGAGITTTELGEVLYEKKVWTNVNPFGDAYLEDPASTCASWTSADKLNSARLGYNAVAPGDAAALAEWTAKKQWLSFSSEGCNFSYRIYCVEAS
ncbi:MAG TPA: hypothetical protein VGB85_31565 [Nannocystis sp.]